MAEGGLTLAPFYDGWDRYNELLREGVAGLSDEQLAFAAAPHLRPVALLAAHVISARVYWFHEVLGAGEADLAPLMAWDEEAPRSGGELARGLETSWALISDCLARWTPAMLEDEFPASRGRTLTRQWVIWHVIEHDLHHGGEMFFTLGMHGLPTPDL